jgi:hypothetical protein
MVRRSGPGGGSSQASPADLAKEAEAELRRAGALGQSPRSMTSGSMGSGSMGSGVTGSGSGLTGSGRPAPMASERDDRHSFDRDDRDDVDDLDGLDDDEYEPWTPEEEARAVTDFAKQQLAERGHRPGPSQYRGTPATVSSTPEEMRSRALADLAERQRRLAEQHPLAARPDRIWESPSVGARARAAPILTAAPMINLPRVSGVPRDSGARASMGGLPRETGAPPRGTTSGAFARRVEAMKRRDAEGGPPGVDAGGTVVTTRRGVTRRSTARGTPGPHSHRNENGEAADGMPSPPTGPASGDTGEPSSSPSAGRPAPSAAGRSSVDAQGALTGASHATLSAIAVLLASMEVLPAPLASDDDQSRLYAEVTHHMTRLSVVLERYLSALPPEWPEV